MVPTPSADEEVLTKLEVGTVELWRAELDRLLTEYVGSAVVDEAVAEEPVRPSADDDAVMLVETGTVLLLLLGSEVGSLLTEYVGTT